MIQTMETHGFASVETARDLLARLGASPRLLQHTVLVGEAAELVLEAIARHGIPVDAHFVRLGVVFHDAGKILHPEELAGPGHAHEPAGERLLIENGVEPLLARCCVSHARWADEGTSFEERLIALADKLWKGKRETELEKAVMETVALLSRRTFWDVFVDLDTSFERVAAAGNDRLARSAPSGEICRRRHR
jgi:hypothetical protein